MRTIHQTIYYEKRGHVFNLYHITDAHKGAKAHRERLFRHDIQQIANDPNALWTFGGDGIDAICHIGDKRYDPRTLAPWALGENDVMGVQNDALIKDLEPIAGKCMGYAGGNHEASADRHYGRNVYWEQVKGVARAGKVEPESLALGYQGFVVLTFRRGTPKAYGGSWKMVIYISHGYGGGRLPGGHALALNRVLGDYQCDIALLGHRHVLEVTPKIITAPDDQYNMRLAAFVPSYLDAYIKPSGKGAPVDTYIEGVGLPPQPLGTFPIYVQPDTRRIWFMVSNQSGIIPPQAHMWQLDDETEQQKGKAAA